MIPGHSHFVKLVEVSTDTQILSEFENIIYHPNILMMVNEPWSVLSCS